MARRGDTPQNAARCAYERDDTAVKDWLLFEYPKNKARAKREDAEMSWGEETGVRLDESRHCCYAPPGQTPIIKSTAC